MAWFDLTTLGEAMLRLSVPAGTRLEMARQFDVCPAGAEANVAAALSRLGHRCCWVSALPDQALGRLVVQVLRQAGVDCSAVVWRGGRIGTYYVEFATPPRSTQVIYDRSDSCFTQLEAEQIAWQYLLDTRLLHLTGITPPLSPQGLRIIEIAIQKAREKGVAISFDVNFRRKLWTADAAAAVLRPLIQEVDLLFCSGRDARTLFGCSGTPQDILHQLLDISRAKQVVVTLAEDGVIGWDGAQILTEPARPVGIVDRIGAGDALAAGVIHGWLQGDFAAALRYGVTMAALALSQHGDMVVTTREELESLIAAAGGDVVR